MWLSDAGVCLVRRLLPGAVPAAVAACPSRQLVRAAWCGGGSPAYMRPRPWLPVRHDISPDLHGTAVAWRPARASSHAACLLGRFRLISHDLSANKYYFSFTPNQTTVPSAMTYNPDNTKQTGLWLHVRRRGGSPACTPTWHGLPVRRGSPTCTCLRLWLPVGG